MIVYGKTGLIRPAKLTDEERRQLAQEVYETVQRHMDWKWSVVGRLFRMNAQFATRLYEEHSRLLQSQAKSDSSSSSSS